MGRFCFVGTEEHGACLFGDARRAMVGSSRVDNGSHSGMGSGGVFGTEGAPGLRKGEMGPMIVETGAGDECVTVVGRREEFGAKMAGGVVCGGGGSRVCAVGSRFAGRGAGGDVWGQERLGWGVGVIDERGLE